MQQPYWEPKPPTIRQYLSRRKRQAMFVQLAGFALFIRTAVVTSARTVPSSVFPWPVLIGYGVFMLGFLIGWIRLRCPNCRTRWTHLAYGGGSPLGIDKRLQVCPYCRAELDGPVPAEPSPPAP